MLPPLSDEVACSSLNRPVIRDNHIRYKGQFGTEYVRNIEIMSIFSKSCILFVPFKISLFIS